MANKDHIFVLGKEAIVDVKHMATSDPDIIKLVIRSTERMKDAYVVINNVDYPAFTNLDEPYDFRVKYQTIRDYGWSVTLAFDWMNT